MTLTCTCNDSQGVHAPNCVHWDQEKERNMIKPITPDEVVDEKEKGLPPEVLAVFNTLVARHWDGTSSKFKKKDAEAMLTEKLNCEKKHLYDNGYLDIEPIYRKVGWYVHFDRPGFNETYDATYEFKKSTSSQS